MKPITGTAKRALAVIQRYYPLVTRVKNATDKLQLEVKPCDIRGAVPKDPKRCVFGKCATRSLDVDGALVFPTVLYLITGKIATRYNVSQKALNNIASFDRKGQNGVSFFEGLASFYAPRRKDYSPDSKRGRAISAGLTGRKNSARRKTIPSLIGVRSYL